MKNYLQRRKRIFCLVAPALIGLLYIILCFINIRQSIWFDESYSSYITRFDYPTMLRFTAADVHPPLYYIVLKTWAHFFGHTDFAMRILSAFLGAAAIVFVFLWLKYKHGASAAILGSLMVAISPVFVRYGQEMRMYTMVALIVFAATYVLQLAVDNGAKKWWVIYAILLAAGMYTHYFAAFAWIAHLVYLIKIYGKKIFQKKIIFTYIAAVVMYLPWIPSFIAQATTVQNGFWISKANATSFMDYWTEVFLYDKAANIQNWLLVLFIATVLTIAYLAIRYRKKLAMIFCLAFVPLIVLILLSMPPLESMFISRYIVYAMVAISILEALLIVLFAREKMAQKIKKGTPFYKYPAVHIAIVVALFVSCSICGLKSVYDYGNYNFVTDVKPTAKEAFDNLVALDNGENLSIISEDPWLYYDLAVYTSDQHNVYFIDEQTSYEYGSLLPLKESYFGKINDLDKFLEKRDAVWYIGKYSKDQPLAFPREGWRVTTEASWRFDERGDRYEILKLERD